LKTNSILFIYGVGGHKEQMKRLIKILNLDLKEFKKIALVEKGANINSFDKIYSMPPARDKHSHIKSIVTLPYFLIYSFFIIFKILLSYNTRVIISTGPGIVFIPSLVFRLIGKKVIFIETWSRFNTASFTGKLMYRIANTFYVQNKELLKVYPKAIYSGRL
jgi:beta-1,4-N-acetylglucosaminyltransferase